MQLKAAVELLIVLRLAAAPSQAFADKHSLEQLLDSARAALPSEPDRAIELLRDWHDAPGAACLLGHAYLGKGDSARAYFFLKRCSGQPSATGDDRKALGKVRKTVRSGEFAPVLLSASPASARIEFADFLPDVDVGPDGEVWLPFGGYTLTAEAPGFESITHEIEVAGLDRQIVNLTLSAREEASTESTVDFSDTEGPSEAGTVEAVADPRPKQHASLMPDRYRRAPDPATPTDEPGITARSLATPTIVAGAVLLTGGIILHVNAAQVRADANELPPGPERKDKRDSASTRQTVGLVMDGVGVAAIAVGLYLLLRDDGKPGTGAAVALTPTAGGIGASIQF